MKESEVFETLPLIEYDVNLAQIGKWKEEFMPLVITDLEDKEQLNTVHTARMVMVKARTTIEKARKAQKAKALQYGRDVDTAAGILFDESNPIEEHLQAEENKVLNERKRIEEERAEIEKVKIQERINTLFSYNVVLPFQDVAAMTDDDFENLRQKSEEAWSAEIVRLAEEEAMRIQRDKELAKAQAEIVRKAAEQAERDRKVAEQEEALRIERKAFENAKQAEIDREKAEQVKGDKKQADKEEALRIERDKFEQEKRNAEEKKNREAFEIKAKEEARIKAEKDAKEKIEREALRAAEKREAEKAEAARQEALKPDKEKLIAWADSIASLVVPEVQDPKAKVIVENAEMAIETISQTIISKAGEM